MVQPAPRGRQVHGGLGAPEPERPGQGQPGLRNAKNQATKIQHLHGGLLSGASGCLSASNYWCSLTEVNKMLVAERLSWIFANAIIMVRPMEVSTKLTNF